MNKQENTKGITLVALVVTIIVLILLAGISINLVLGENGIITKAKEARRLSEEAQLKESIQMDLINKQSERINENFELTQNDIENVLSKYGTINKNTDGTIKSLTPTGRNYEIAYEDLWQENVTAIYNEAKKVNAPELLTGMRAIKFTNPTEQEMGKVVTTNKEDVDWYDYNTKKWANAQTQDGSMWVWIPRFAYKIEYKTTDKSDGGTIHVVFLIGTTDNYYGEDGSIKTAKRVTSTQEKAETTTDYYVHPAFTNESSIGYVNGGWDTELSGIWVAKFEAGYENTNIAFKGKLKSVTDKNNNEVFQLAKNLANGNNLYGLSSSNADSHLMKNSEWGAVAYLGYSQYGQNGNEMTMNNTEITGCNSNKTTIAKSTSTTVESMNAVSGNIPNQEGIYAWNQQAGQSASSTGTIYGIYDMSGCSWERIAAFLLTGTTYLLTYDKSLLDEAKVEYNEEKQTVIENSGNSTKYVTVYPQIAENSTQQDSECQQNYANFEKNSEIFGDAIKETTGSKAGTSEEGWLTNSWNKDGSRYPSYDECCFLRGGGSASGSMTGNFAYSYTRGGTDESFGFRVVLVAK